jgi:NADPH:quinone reductase-like Zn-dependent oxidoreductase
MRGTQGDGAGHRGGGLGHVGIQSLKVLTAAMSIVIDRNQAALELVRGYGSDHTVPAADSEVDKVLELTDGQSAEGRLRLLWEQGAETKGRNLTSRAGSHYIMGYGGTVKIATIDIISSERNIVGNLVGTYNLVEPMGARRPGTAVQPHLSPRRSQRRHELWATHPSSILEPANAAVMLWLDDPFAPRTDAIYPSERPLIDRWRNSGLSSPIALRMTRE